MGNQITIPSPETIPLPAPAWLLHILLVFTFILHIIAMNFALGSGILTALSYSIGWRRGSEKHRKLAKGLGAILPYAIAATITLGVAPLLFIQVLFGQFIYTSSILIAIPWILVVPLLILGYYGFYYYYFKSGNGNGPRPFIVWLSALAFLIIAFIYTNNMVLMLKPEVWRKLYFVNPHGFHLYLSEPTIIPRFLHFLVASIAISGVLISYYGCSLIKKDENAGKWAVSYGVKWFTYGTLIQFLVGLWFLFSLPAGIRQAFLGGDLSLTAHLITGIVLAVIAIAVFHYSARRKNPLPGVIVGSLLVFLVVATMAIMRDTLRSEYLAPHWQTAGIPHGLSSLPVKPQWDVFFLFVLLLIVAVVTVLWMIVKVAKSARAQASP